MKIVPKESRILFGRILNAIYYVGLKSKLGAEWKRPAKANNGNAFWKAMSEGDKKEFTKLILRDISYGAGETHISALSTTIKPYVPEVTGDKLIKMLRDYRKAVVQTNQNNRRKALPYHGNRYDFKLFENERRLKPLSINAYIAFFEKIYTRRYRVLPTHRPNLPEVSIVKLSIYDKYMSSPCVSAEIKGTKIIFTKR